MKKINCIVADDEVLARDIIETHISKVDKLNLVATFSNGTQLYNALESLKIYLVFLDIQMPMLTGIKLLRALKTPPAVILTTAYREFALEGTS